MAVKLAQHPVLTNVFDLVVNDTYGWRMPASWWRAQTRESLSAIGADDLGASVEAVLAAIERALPSDVAQVVSELRQAAGLPADYPYTHELVALKSWIEAHRKVSGMMTLSDKQDLDAFRAKAAAVRKQLEPSDYEAPDATIVGTLHHWLGALLGKRPATEEDITQLEIALSSLQEQVEKTPRSDWRIVAGAAQPMLEVLYEARERLQAHEAEAVALRRRLQEELARTNEYDAIVAVLADKDTGEIRNAKGERVAAADAVRELSHAMHWEPLLRESLERVLRAVTGKADTSAMVGEIGTPGFDALVEQLGCDRAMYNDWDEELAQIKDRHEHELRTQTNMRQEVAEALGLERAASIVKIIAEARRRAGAVAWLRKVCAAVLGIEVSEVDADPDVEVVIADMWKAPRRAVPEALFGRLLADLGAEASRVLGAAPTDLVYSANHEDDTVIGRLRECIRDSETLRRSDLRSEHKEILTLMREENVPPEVDVLPWLRGLLARPVLQTDAADQVRRLQVLVDRQGNELGELRKVVGRPTDLELRRMICQDVVERGRTIARLQHEVDRLRSDLHEAEAALRSEHERTAEVSIAAQQEVRRTVERVDDVLSRVVSVENVQHMHDLLGEAPDADDHVTRLLARYTDLIASAPPPQADASVLEFYRPCPTHGVHSFPSKPCYVCGWKPVREDSHATPLEPHAGRVLGALRNLIAIAEYKPTPGATINVSGLPGRGVWVRDEGLQYVPGILPARLGRTFKFMSPLSARPIICTWLGEFAVYDGVRLAPVYLPDEVPAFDPTVVPTAPFDHPEERESNHTAARRNNSESPIDDLAETLRATRQDAAELETEVARLEVELQAWRTWPSGHV